MSFVLVIFTNLYNYNIITNNIIQYYKFTHNLYNYNLTPKTVFDMLEHILYRLEYVLHGLEVILHEFEHILN